MTSYETIRFSPHAIVHFSRPKGEHNGFWRESKLGWEEARRHNEAPRRDAQARRQARRKDAGHGGVGEEQSDILGDSRQRPHYWLLREACDANLLVNYI